jgi:hypothetical protein
MTELAAPQISSLMEALPGIAAVLRSPVANAIVALSRAGAGLEEFRPSEAEELLRYGVRRNLLTQDEVDRILGEIRMAVSHRPAKPQAPAPEKPKKAPAAPRPEFRIAPAKAAAAPPMAKPAAHPAPAKAVAKPAAKPAAKVSAKPAAKATASKAKVVEKKVASARPAAKKAVAKTAAKKSGGKKGHH